MNIPNTFNQTFDRQCILRSGMSTTVGWIPEKYARVGIKFRLKNDDENRWWEVTEIFTRLTSEQVAERRDDYRKHRDATDI